MVFSFDSLAASLLLAVAIWSWRMARELRASVRVYVRFAAVLLAALAASLLVPAPGLAFNVMLLTVSVAGAGLALAFCFRQGAPSWLSATALTLAFAVGLSACLAALPVVAFALMAAATGCIMAAGFSRMKENPGVALAAILGSTALLLGALAMIEGGVASAALFLASALGLTTRALHKSRSHLKIRA